MIYWWRLSLGNVIKSQSRSELLSFRILSEDWGHHQQSWCVTDLWWCWGKVPHNKYTFDKDSTLRSSRSSFIYQLNYKGLCASTKNCSMSFPSVPHSHYWFPVREKVVQVCQCQTRSQKNCEIRIYISMRRLADSLTWDGKAEVVSISASEEKLH